MWPGLPVRSWWSLVGRGNWEIRLWSNNYEGWQPFKVAPAVGIEKNMISLATKSHYMLLLPRWQRLGGGTIFAFFQIASKDCSMDCSWIQIASKAWPCLRTVKGRGGDLSVREGVKNLRWQNPNRRLETQSWCIAGLSDQPQHSTNNRSSDVALCCEPPFSEQHIVLVWDLGNSEASLFFGGSGQKEARGSCYLEVGVIPLHWKICQTRITHMGESIKRVICLEVLKIIWSRVSRHQVIFRGHLSRHKTLIIQSIIIALIQTHRNWPHDHVLPVWPSLIWNFRQSSSTSSFLASPSLWRTVRTKSRRATVNSFITRRSFHVATSGPKVPAEPCSAISSANALVALCKCWPRTTITILGNASPGRSGRWVGFHEFVFLIMPTIQEKAKYWEVKVNWW